MTTPCTFPLCEAPATHRVVSTHTIHQPHTWEVCAGGEPGIQPCHDMGHCQRTGRCQEGCDRWRYRQPEWCLSHAEEVAALRNRKALPPLAPEVFTTPAVPAPTRARTRRAKEGVER